MHPDREFSGQDSVRPRSRKELSWNIVGRERKVVLVDYEVLSCNKLKWSEVWSGWIFSSEAIILFFSPSPLTAARGLGEFGRTGERQQDVCDEMCDDVILGNISVANRCCSLGKVKPSNFDFSISDRWGGIQEWRALGFYPHSWVDINIDGLDGSWDESQVLADQYIVIDQRPNFESSSDEGYAHIYQEERSELEDTKQDKLHHIGLELRWCMDTAHAAGRSYTRSLLLRAFASFLHQQGPSSPVQPTIVSTDGGITCGCSICMWPH